LPFAAEVTQVAPEADPVEPDPDEVDPDEVAAGDEVAAAEADEEGLADDDGLDEGIADPDVAEAEADGEALAVVGELTADGGLLAGADVAAVAGSDAAPVPVAKAGPHPASAMDASTAAEQSTRRRGLVSFFEISTSRGSPNVGLNTWFSNFYVSAGQGRGSAVRGSKSAEVPTGPAFAVDGAGESSPQLGCCRSGHVKPDELPA
jgi:hypothetical protein